MKSMEDVRLAARYLRHCLTTGKAEAGRRYREKREDARISAELRAGPAMDGAERERQRQAAAAAAQPVRFEVRFLRGGPAEPAPETLESLREQTYGHYTLGPSAAPDGDYVVFMETDGWLHPGALFTLAERIGGTGADFLYTDEDYYTDCPPGLNRPYCKQDYGPDSLRGCNYAGPLLVCSRALLRRAGAEGFAEADGDARWDATLRLAEAAERIEHVARILYYRKAGAGNRIPVPATRRMPAGGQDGGPLVSILIPNRDHREDLARCVDSIREKSTYARYEIIIIENNSTEPETFRYYEELEKDSRIRVVRREGPFNFSAVINRGFREARGEQILLLNNDTEVTAPGWLEEMLVYARRPDVGAVGAKLVYPDGTIQHAGIGIGIAIAAGHYHRGFPKDSPGYYGRLQYAQDVSAVTGACMMVPRHVFEAMNGLDEGFSIVFNDVDLCLRIREAGYLVVWTPWAELIHHESKSRGPELETKEKKRFFVRETNRFLRKWHRALEAGDPYYNPNLTRIKEDFSLRGE